MMLHCAERIGPPDRWREWGWPADAAAAADLAAGAARVGAGLAGLAGADKQGMSAGQAVAPGGRPAGVDMPGRAAVAADKPDTAAVRVAVEPVVVEWLPRLGFERPLVMVAPEHCYCFGFAVAGARSAAAIRPVELLPARHWQQVLRPFQEPLACFAWYQYPFGRHLFVKVAPACTS